MLNLGKISTVSLKCPPENGSYMHCNWALRAGRSQMCFEFFLEYHPGVKGLTAGFCKLSKDRVFNIYLQKENNWCTNMLLQKCFVK